MDFKDKLLVQVLLGLIRVLAASSEQRREVASPGEEAKPPEAVGVPRLVLFDDLDDRLHRGNDSAAAADWSHRRSRERISQLKRSEGRGRKTGWSKSREREEVDDRRKGKLLRTNRPARRGPFRLVAQAEISKAKQSAMEEFLSTSFLDFQEDLKMLKNQIKILGNLLGVFKNLRKGTGKNAEKFLSRLLEKVPRRLEEDEGGRFKRINNVTYNNRYQIGGVFIINGASEEKGGVGGKVSTAHETKQFLISASDGSPEGTVVGFPLASGEAASIDELRRNFFRIFHRRNITAEQLSEMAKVVDFVERYRGVVGGGGAPANERTADGKSRTEDALRLFPDSEGSSSAKKKLLLF